MLGAPLVALRHYSTHILRLGIAAVVSLVIWDCKGPAESKQVTTITEITASPDQVNIGGTAIVTADVESDDMYRMEYIWSASGGIVRDSGPTISWYAPLDEGIYTVQCKVRDYLGNEDSAQVEITVQFSYDPLGHWAASAPLPTARQEMASVAVEGKIYVVGGINANWGTLKVVEAFDPETNTWSEEPPLPQPRHHLGLAAVNGKMYVIGGSSRDYPGINVVNIVYEYDPVSGAWSTKSPMPTPRYAHATVVLNGKIHVIGGATLPTQDLSTHEAYDPQLNSWETLAPLPVPRNHLSASVLNSRIYVVGGRRNWMEEGSAASRNYALLHVYSPANDTWTSLPEMPMPRGALATAALDGKLYVMGGESMPSNIAQPPGVFEENEVYDPVTATWSALKPMMTPRHGMTAVPLGGIIYVIGGGSVELLQPSSANEGFLPP